MNRPRAALIACAATVLLSACATKGFVREQVGSTETRLSQKVDTQETKLNTQETKLNETSNRTAANTQAIETTEQRVQGLDGRVGEVSALAADAKREATTVASAQREAETAFNQKLANRNKYAVVETKTIYFDFNKADLRDEGFSELADVVKALEADPNAIVELQGFADPRGSDHYNLQLTRERVDTVVRYLVQKHGVDLRRVHAVGMGKETPERGVKQNKETLAKARRVDLRVVAPQS